MNLPIIHKEKEFFIINKPAGLLVHPTGTSTEPTLVDALVALDPSLVAVGDPARPGLVHRLDRDTSGIMVVPRTAEMHEYLKERFMAREVQKTYIALVHGKVAKDAGEITFPIGRSKRRGRMAARPTGEEGRAARTNYEVVKRFPHQTLLSVSPETGRTHQIRAHLFALGHPIVGDPLYQARKERQGKKTKLPRLMLHAWKITFTDMAGHRHTFEAPLPPEFQTLIH